MTIGERIKEARKYRNMTQKQLAIAADVATGTIQQYELGKREPRYEILINIARALKISVAALCDSGPTPIDQLTPEAVADSINKSRQFEEYLHSLGWEIVESYEFDGDMNHTLLVDHNRGKLFLVKGPYWLGSLEQSVESYTKFSVEELVAKGNEIADTQGWLSSDPRKDSIDTMLYAVPENKKPPQE